MAESRFRRTAGGVSSLGLHLVWCPRYRRRLLGGCVAVRLGELLERIAAENGWEIVAGEVMADHVHLFVRVRPVDAPAQVVRKFEGRTVRVLRQECRWLADSEVLWSPSYLAGSVGSVSAATVRRYLEHGWDAVA
ncbi:MAG TPA: IS200/IS605 family transposase [Aldersonia sp.]